MTSLQKKIMFYLESEWPSYTSCITVANAMKCQRASAYNILGLLQEEGLVEKKKNAAPGPKQNNYHPTDPMISTRVNKVIGWRLNKGDT